MNEYPTHKKGKQAFACFPNGGERNLRIARLERQLDAQEARQGEGLNEAAYQARTQPLN